MQSSFAMLVLWAYFPPQQHLASGWRAWQMRPGGLSKTPLSLTGMRDKRSASLMDGSGSYLPPRRTITKIFPRYLAGHLTKLSSFMMLIFPLSRQLQIQTALSVSTYCTHTYTRKPIFLPMVFTGMFLPVSCLVVNHWTAPKCLLGSPFPWQGWHLIQATLNCVDALEVEQEDLAPRCLPSPAPRRKTNCAQGWAVL